MKFYINKTQITIEFSFILVIAFSVLFNIENYLYVLFFSVMHETGHLLSLILMRKNADKITLSYYGIGLKHSCNFSVMQELIFLISGVFVNLLFYLFNIQKNINLCLLIINILPIYPLDGGRILKSILNIIFNLDIADKVFYIFSSVFFAALIIFGVFTKNLSLLLISFYVIIYSVNNSID